MAAEPGEVGAAKPLLAAGVDVDHEPTYPDIYGAKVTVRPAWGLPEPGAPVEFSTYLPN